MSNIINTAIEKVRSTQYEYNKAIVGLPNHNLFIRPQEPDVAYILDLRDLKQVRTILLKNVDSKADIFNIYQAILPKFDDMSQERLRVSTLGEGSIEHRFISKLFLSTFSGAPRHNGNNQFGGFFNGRIANASITSI